MPQTKSHEDLLIVDELRVDKLKLDSVEVTGGFGDGGAGEDVATFSGAKGDNLNLIASGGFWYITGAHQVSVA